MGRSVDDHRVILYQGSTCRDITAATASVELRDELDALSVEVSFTALRNNLNDKYAHWYNIAPGDKLRIVNGGAEVFSGVILEVGQDGSVRANDPGWYLTRSQIILQLDRAAAPDAVARMCAKAGIKAGRVELPPTRISKEWWGETPESILEDILDICTAETGKTYIRRVREGALQVYPLPQTAVTLYHKPAASLGAFDVTLAKGTISGSDSMEDLVNSVVLVDKDGDAGRVLGRASNAASIAKYGLLQQVESLSGDENTAQARQRVKNLLQQQDKITKERTVEDLWGDDAAVSGALVQFVSNRYDVSGPMRITGVTHRYGAPEERNRADRQAATGGGKRRHRDRIGGSMSWDYELANEIRRVGRVPPSPALLRGTVVKLSPLTVSLCDGEVMAPPMELNCVVAAQGFYRDKDNGHLYLEKWKTGDMVVCGLMGKTVVILGRLGGTAWAIPTR